MKSLTKRLGFTFIALTITALAISQQRNVFEIVQQRSMRIDQIEQNAKRYFDSVGTERGTGYKQYQRWLYEVRFHLDDNGFQRAADFDGNTYEAYRTEERRKLKSSVNLLSAATDPWTEKGPFNWNRTSGWNPGVGRITSISVHPLDSNLIFVTTPGGGVWKTTDGGANWKALTDDHASWMNMLSVAVDPTNKDIVYAGSNAGILLKSTDGGATWLSIGRGFSGTVSKIIVQPSNSSIIFAALQNGIFRSTDGGTNWVKTYSGNTEDIEFKPDDPNIMYATGPFSPSVARSTDNGITWVALTSNEGITNSARSLIAVSAADPNRVYIVQAYGNEFGRLYVSTNAGASFTTSVTGSSAGCTNFFGYETTGCGSGGQAGYDMAITANPANANEVYIAGIIVFKSNDGGKTFAPQTAWSYPNSIGYNHPDVHALEFFGKNIYSGSDGGIYVSKDYGDNWTDISKGLGIRQFYRIASSKTNGQLFTGGAQDNGTSTYKSTGWYDWLGADGMDGIISPTNENLMWGTSQYGQIYRSTNGGASYTTLSKPSSGEWVTPLVYHEKTNTIYAGWTGVYKSTDNGDTWTSVSGSNINSTITALAVAPSNENFIYAGRSTNLYITSDGGKTWTSSTLPSSINAVAVNPNSPNKIWVVCNSSSNRVFMSADTGKTFTNMSGNLPALVARSIAVDNDTEESVYLGMNVGVYYLNNSTTSWTDISNNLPKVAINDLDIQKSSGILRVATYGRGVWERSLLGTQQNVAPCGTPANPQTISTSTTSANVGWDAVSSATQYKVEYKLPSSTTWITVSDTISANNVLISNLSAATTYDWRVSANCGASTGSYATSQFQTANSCTAPSSITASNITSSQADINWVAVTNAVSYSVDYKLSSDSTWITLLEYTTGTSTILTNLAASTSYNVRVRAQNSFAISEYTSTTFTTAAVAICSDMYESNNTSKQAKSLTIGNQISALISTSTDEDWFKITVGSTNKTNLKISLTQLPGDYDIFLYDRNLRMIASSQLTGTANDILVYNSTATKASYFIKVVGKNKALNASSCYKLTTEASSTAYTPAAGVAFFSEEPAPSDIALFPNPASTKFSLQFASPSENLAIVEISNAAGAVQKSMSVNVYQGMNKVDINVANLKAGVYIVRLNSNNIRVQKQLIIVK